MRCPLRFRANGELTRAGCSFDIDLPTECDDEYWTASEPELAFKQPPGKPSKITFFNCYVRLHQILAFAMRTIVSLPLLSLSHAGLRRACLGPFNREREGVAEC